MGDNRRTTERYAVAGLVKIFGEGLSPTLTGKILDLSLGGCLLKVDSEVWLAQDSEIELTIQSRGASFRVKGQVKKRGKSTNPVGIQFALLTPRVQEDVAYLIGELEQRAKEARGDPSKAPGGVERRTRADGVWNEKERRGNR